jgi:hypothetical protein
MWFQDLVGFREGEVWDVSAQFRVDGQWLTSRANGRRMRHGRFETPSLAELRQRAAEDDGIAGRLSVREIVADSQSLHTDPTNAGALFQVASQFNTLEMVSPSVTPEDGIERYATDRTQGPACAVACGAGTIYRNYLVDLDGQRGQSAHRQVECLADLAAALGVEVEVRNGYALPTEQVLNQVGAIIDDCDPTSYQELMGQLRIGLQWDTEVTLDDAGRTVAQAYCSALPVAYSSLDTDLWEPFARLVLDAAYEATLAAATINARSTGNNRAFLTLLGGGAFGNRTPWILDALDRALRLYTDRDLDVAIVSYRHPNPDLGPLLHQ